MTPASEIRVPPTPSRRRCWRAIAPIDTACATTAAPIHHQLARASRPSDSTIRARCATTSHTIATATAASRNAFHPNRRKRLPF